MVLMIIYWKQYTNVTALKDGYFQLKTSNCTINSASNIYSQLGWRTEFIVVLLENGNMTTRAVIEMGSQGWLSSDDYNFDGNILSYPIGSLQRCFYNMEWNFKDESNVRAAFNYNEEFFTSQWNRIVGLGSLGTVLSAISIIVCTLSARNIQRAPLAALI